MKRNIVTLLGVVAIIAIIAVVRSTFQQTIQTETEAKEAAEIEKKLDEAAGITDKAKETEEKAASNVAEAATTDAAAAESAPADGTPAPQADSAPMVTVDLSGFEEVPWEVAVPDVFQAKFSTTKGDFIVESHKEWSPLGHERFYELCSTGFFNNAGFFRVVKTPEPFVVQFGLAADPRMTAQYERKNLLDEPVMKSNQRGKLTFAKSGAPNSRTTQIFINYGDNARLDDMGFAPFAEVIAGMEIVDSLNGEYADAPTGRQGEISAMGNTFLKKNFPNLDYINTVTLVKAVSEPQATPGE